MQVAGPASGLEDLERARGVGVVGRHRILDGPRDRRARREVHDRGGTGECLVQRVGIEDRVLDQFDVGSVEVAAQACRQVVEGHHVVDLAPRQQFPAQIGADEAGSARDHNLHPSLISVREVARKLARALLGRSFPTGLLAGHGRR